MLIGVDRAKKEPDCHFKGNQLIAKELTRIQSRKTSKVNHSIKYLAHTLCKIYQFQSDISSL
jgi:hypothetical protein